MKEIKPISNAVVRRGGSRPGAGRKKGRLNRATEEQKATIEQLARSYAPEALETLARVMRDGQSEAARVAAANSLLDRGYGKPRQLDPAPGVEVNINHLEVNMTQVNQEIDELLRDSLARPPILEP